MGEILLEAVAGVFAEGEKMSTFVLKNATIIDGTGRDPLPNGPGKLADLIFLNGDPLQDMKRFQPYHDKSTLIIQGGRIFKNLLYGR